MNLHTNGQDGKVGGHTVLETHCVVLLYQHHLRPARGHTSFFLCIYIKSPFIKKHTLIPLKKWRIKTFLLAFPSCFMCDLCAIYKAV